MYKPIYDDLMLVQQNIINYKIKIEVYNFDDEKIEEINCGLISGNTSIDAESDVRRTASLVLLPDAQSDLKVDENNVIWLNKKIKIHIGIQDNISKEYKYWANGVYVFMNTSATYDSVTNQINVDCSDMMSYWDGTRAGKIGSKKIEYPAHVESIFNVTGGDEWIKQKDEVAFANQVSTLANKPKYDAIFTFTYTGSTHDVETSDKWTITYPKEDEQIQTLTNQVASNWGIFGKGTITSDTFTVHYFYKNGEPISYNYIRDAMINAVTQLGQLTRYNIDWLGEAKAQPNYLEDWDYEWYRESTAIEGLDGNKYLQCFVIPHDIEFTSDTTVLNVVTELRDLYENYETFFDENGIFYCRLKPSGDNDEITVDNNFIDSILISEETTLDFTEVKNVTEAWGKCFEPDWFTQTAATYTDNTYSINIPNYTDADHTDYSNGDEIAFLVNNENSDNPKLKVNNLSAIDIIDENTEIGISAGTLVPNTIYTFKIKKTYDTVHKTNVIKAYFQGNWEVHAMDVLTDGSEGEEVELHPTEEETVITNKYSRKYFQTMFNCENVHLTQIVDSPFTIQKLGVLLNVYSNEDMTSDSLGTEGARQENYRTCRLTDNITITTKLCPFIDVNQKVLYRKRDKKNPEEFLIKHIDHDLTNGTTTWQLMKYYRLYITDDVVEKFEIATDYIPKDEFVLYNRVFNINNRSLYFDITLPQDFNETIPAGSTHKVKKTCYHDFSGLYEWGQQCLECPGANTAEIKVYNKKGTLCTLPNNPRLTNACSAHAPHQANLAPARYSHEVWVDEALVTNDISEVTNYDNLELCVVSEENSNEYGFKIYSKSEKTNNEIIKTRLLKIINGSSENTIDISFIDNIEDHMRIIINHNGIFLNGETISDSLLSTVINKIAQLRKIKIYGKNNGYHLNHVDIINRIMSLNESINRSKILIKHGYYIASDNNIISINTEFKPKYIAVLPGVLTTKYTTTTSMMCVYDEDYSNQQYRYSAANGLYKSVAIDGLFKENDPQNTYNTYPPGIYSIENDGFKMVKNKGIIQYYFALPDIDSMNFMDYSDKFAKGEFTVTGGKNRTYDVEIGFTPKYLAIIDSDSNGNKTTIIYDKDYNSNQYLKSDSKNVLTLTKFGINKENNLYDLKSLGFSIYEPLESHSYKYFAIG